MLKRYIGESNISKYCEYQKVMYFSGVTADGETTYEQAKAALKKYGELFAERALRREHVVNAFVIIDDSDADGFYKAWDEWLAKDVQPALTIIRAGLEGDAKVLICLWVATDGDIRRIDLEEDGGKLVLYNGVAYFSGQSIYDDMTTLTDQTKAIMARYDRFLAANGLKKENILNGNIYCQVIEMQDEYEEQWINWTYTGHKPAGTMVEGKPLNKENLLTLGLSFADSPEVLDIERMKPGANCCRYVAHNKVAYFTGHVCADPAAVDLYDHTKGVLQRFTEAFKEYGLSMDNIITASAYISDINDAPLFKKAWDEWVKPGCEPARNICGTRLLSDTFKIELSIIVACE